MLFWFADKINAFFRFRKNTKISYWYISHILVITIKVAKLIFILLDNLV